MKTLLFKIAHSIKGNYNNFSEALKQAWKVIKLKTRMKSQNVTFKFRKVDGTVRNAVGTLNIEYQSKGTKAPNFSNMSYFDVEKNSFRSFNCIGLL